MKSPFKSATNRAPEKKFKKDLKAQPTGHQKKNLKGL